MLVDALADSTSHVESTEVDVADQRHGSDDLITYLLASGVQSEVGSRNDG